MDQKTNVSDFSPPLAIQELLHSFPHLDRYIAETLLIMHERGRLNELSDTSSNAAQHPVNEDQFVQQGAIIVTQNISSQI